MTPTVLLLGATGYVGGSVLAAFKKSYPSATFITPIRTSAPIYTDAVASFLKDADIDVKPDAVNRSPSQIDKIRSAGGEPVICSFEDYALLTKLSSQADIIINAADSDNPDLLNSLLEGQRRRKIEGKGAGSFIQVSGCNIFLSRSPSGTFDAESVRYWTDSEDDIRSINTSMIHGQVDVPLMKASESGDVHSFIVCPSVIYGLGSGPDKRDSLFFRMMVSDILRRGAAYHIGEGSNKFGFVHIEDLVDLCEKVFKLALDASTTTAPSTSPYERYYIASPSSITWKELAELFGRELHRRGRIDSPEALKVTLEDGGPFASMLSSNMMTKGTRARELGWNPKYTVLSEEAFVEQVDLALHRL